MSDDEKILKFVEEYGNLCKKYGCTLEPHDDGLRVFLVEDDGLTPNKGLG